MTLYLSKVPAQKNAYGKWFKTIKDSPDSSGSIIANIYGNTKIESTKLAKLFVEMYNSKADFKY